MEHRTADLATDGVAQQVARPHPRLDAAWANWKGIGALAAVNHSTVAVRTIVTGFAFLLAGGVLAMFIRLQLSWSGADVLDVRTYNRFVTMHGTTMMFLFAVPIAEGFAMYLLPKMLGARDLPLPRLSAYGYWCYLLGGLMLYAGLLTGQAPEQGWFMYAPLSDARFSPDKGADFWLLGVTFAEIAAVAGAIEIIVSVLKTRAPGMTLARMPLFAWYMLVTAFMILFAFPPLILGSLLLEIERSFGFAFYDATRGGDPLLWQHLFWLFGHPEVYIIFLPAAGLLSMIIPTFAQRPMAGYKWIVAAIVSVGFLSFGLWVHHMFAVGIPLMAAGFFSAASMAVSIPMGIQIFAWLATLWTGRPRLDIPMLYVVGFFFVFVLGGLTGVMVALVPFDWQVHDTHFVVAHLHYVLIGGLVFPLLAGAYYWLPQYAGRMPSKAVGAATFGLIFGGFNITFLPMHLTGLLGMPRRVYTYDPGLGWEWLNVVSTVGGFMLAAGFVAFAVDVALHLRHGMRAPPNPWRASSLEWALAAPVPSYNFASIPQVDSRVPLWDRPSLPEEIDRGVFYLAHRQTDARETLGTTLLDAKPEHVIILSRNSWWPLDTALVTGLFFLGMLLKLWWLAAAGAAATLACVLAWLWTTGDARQPARIDAGGGAVLPTQSACAQAPGWWAMVLALLADGAWFAALVFSYLYLWLGASEWPAAGSPAPWPWIALAQAALLGASSLAMRAACRANAAARDASGPLAAALVAALCATAWIAWQAAASGPSPIDHAYGSMFQTVTFFAVGHLALALVGGGFALARARHGWVRPDRPLDLQVAAVLWHYAVGLATVALALLHLFALA